MGIKIDPCPLAPLLTFSSVKDNRAWGRKTDWIEHHCLECGILLADLAVIPTTIGRVEITSRNPWRWIAPDVAEIYLFEIGMGIEVALVRKILELECGWIRDCLFEYGICLSVLDDSQGRSRKI